MDSGRRSHPDWMDTLDPLALGELEQGDTLDPPDAAAADRARVSELVCAHGLAWMATLAFALLVLAAGRSAPAAAPFQWLLAWAGLWLGASVMWWGVSRYWQRSWPLAGYGVLCSLAAVVLLWIAPPLATLALLVWLAAAPMLLWGSRPEEAAGGATAHRRQAPGKVLALGHALSALLLAWVWPQVEGGGRVATGFMLGAAALALACYSALALRAWAQHHGEQRCQRDSRYWRQQYLALQQELAAHRAGQQSDPLTGVESLPRVTEYILQLGERHARKGEAFCVALVELDPWVAQSAVARSQGALSPQQRVQILLAGLLSTQTRAIDRLGRYHGDVFALVLSDTEALKAISVLHRIRASMWSTPWEEVLMPAGGPNPHPTLTIGLAEYASGETAEQLLERAEKALRYGRSMGHDRIVVAEDLMP